MIASRSQFFHSGGDNVFEVQLARRCQCGILYKTVDRAKWQQKGHADTHLTTRDDDTFFVLSEKLVIKQFDLMLIPSHQTTVQGALYQHVRQQQAESRSMRTRCEPFKNGDPHLVPLVHLVRHVHLVPHVECPDKIWIYVYTYIFYWRALVFRTLFHAPPAKMMIKLYCS